MKEIDIFDEQSLSRQLEVQSAKGWDLEEDLDWDKGIDISKFLLPLDQNSILFPGANRNQKRVISQLMGLIVASTISELEKVAFDLKEPSWDKFLRKHPISPEFRELGEHFYEDEQKHSSAFSRYIDKFSQELNVDPKDFRKILPQSNQTVQGQIFKLNAMAGGMAIWWLIAAVEEESILFFRYIRESKQNIDPLYYNLHKLHFEEELRHKSYAFMMLKAHEEFSSIPSLILSKKLDFIIAEVLNLTWTFNQLFKVRNFKNLRSHHPFFETLYSLSDILGEMNPLAMLNCLFNEAPYISTTVHMSQQPHIKQLLDRFGTSSMPLPKVSKVGELCTA